MEYLDMLYICTGDAIELQSLWYNSIFEQHIYLQDLPEIRIFGDVLFR